MNRQSSIFNYGLAGLFLGLTFYTYIPARVMWLIFPLLLLFAAWRQRPFWQRAWRGTGLMLLVMVVVAGPLFAYLQANSGVEERIRELSTPLTAVSEGHFQQMLDSTLGSLRLFTFEGDPTWRYNIPGRPFLQPVMGGLFYLGLVFAVARLWGGHERVARAAFLALAWLLAGLSPVLVTGPGLSVTQAMGMQPVLYLFPALALVTLGRLYIVFMSGRQSEAADLFHTPLLLIILSLLLMGATAFHTFRDYFITWANASEVRVQYETTMVTAMDYLNVVGEGGTAVSTITPSRYHSPAVAQLTLHNNTVNIHWFDAQSSLLLPAAEQSTMIIPGFTPLPLALADYFEAAGFVDSLPMRPDDFDRPLEIYRLDGAEMRRDWRQRFHIEPEPVIFGDAVALMGYDLHTPAAKPGDSIRVATLWQVERPLDGAVIFTHLLGPDGSPIAQADRLDVPGESWQSSDWFIQLHEFVLPAETAVGEYSLTTGVYTCPGGIPCPNGQRLMTPTGSDSLYLTPLRVTQ